MSTEAKKASVENDKKLRAARLLLIQANDLLADLHQYLFTSDQYRSVCEAKGHAMAGRKKIDAALSEDV